MPDVTALIVPHGKVLDFVDQSLRRETPEEYVRQEIEKSLVREYEYPRDEIRVEFRIKMGASSKRCDLAIFPEGAAATQENIWAICECKAATVSPDARTDGIEQLWSYMTACPNAEFGMWTNGQERFCYRKLRRNGKWIRVEVGDLPVKGRPIEDAERPTRETLKVAESDALLFTFRRCHNYIAANQGLQKPEAFWELLKLIFCKIEDERSDDLRFYATTSEWQSLNGQMKVRDRFARLFGEVREAYPAIFDLHEEINLEPRVLAYIVAQLQTYSLLESEVDVKGKAYEEIVGSNLRGDRGEFFTPRNICRMAITMLDPGPRDLVVDPACGTGGFLIVAMNHVRQAIAETERNKWGRPDRPTERQLEELHRKQAEYLRNKVVGIDFNPNLVKAAKMNMVMNNDGSGGLYQANSLESPQLWTDPDLRRRELIGKVDLVFTNPPFGSKLPIMEPRILEQYDLAHVWDYDDAADKWEIRERRTLTKSQPPEILFVERCVQLLRPGGRLAIVLPDAILGAPGLAHVREWILQQTRVLASIDLHPDTFQPRNSTQTSLLVLERKSPHQIELERAVGRLADYDVFMALANHIGHDKRGNRTYVRDAEGNEVLETRTKRPREVRDGVPVYSEIEVTEKKIDDTTEDIAGQFRAWLEAEAEAMA